MGFRWGLTAPIVYPFSCIPFHCYRPLVPLRPFAPITLIRALIVRKYMM